ncbi:hypothetical protein REPUB_Repub20aG0102700 [Reevesia pubescens]
MVIKEFRSEIIDIERQYFMRRRFSIEGLNLRRSNSNPHPHFLEDNVVGFDDNINKLVSVLLDDERFRVVSICEEIREAAATEFDHKENEVGKGSIRVKIVLTKEELELLLVKPKNNSNGGISSLEDLLAEMEKARSGKLDSWRPSLESIMEDVDPEGLKMDRS